MLHDSSTILPYPTYIHQSHTRAVVRECFKGDEASQWKRPNSTPRQAKTP